MSADPSPPVGDMPPTDPSLLPPPDFIGDCGQGFVDAWTRSSVEAHATAYALAATAPLLQEIERLKAKDAPRNWRVVLNIDAHEERLDVVRQQYHRARSEHHPDRGGDARLFDEIEKAWQQAQEALGG